MNPTPMKKPLGDKPPGEKPPSEKLPTEKQPSAAEKIFCIGLNKTGTTSIGDALAHFGFRRCGWDGARSHRLSICWHEGKMQPFLEVASNFDAFEDLPWPVVYKQMRAFYPRSKFILTVRRSEDVWLESITRHIRNRWIGHYLVYGAYMPREHPKRYLDKYREHNESVRSFFKDSPNFLEMCFEDGSGWEELCRFLGIPFVPDIPFPHSNRSGAQPGGTP